MKENTINQKGNRMDKRINYILVIDTETANTIDCPLVYDIGGVVTDRQGRIYESFSFAISDIFVFEPELMSSAYYASKIPAYRADIAACRRDCKSFKNARTYILSLINRYNITTVAAYNAAFDRDALNNTLRWLSKSKLRWFFPYGIEFMCIWNMACQTLCQRPTYRDFCEKYNFTSNRAGDPNAKNYSTSAETVYRYLTLSPRYEEEHRGYDDVLIETAIMKRCFETHMAMPNGTGIRRNCWQSVKRTV